MTSDWGNELNQAVDDRFAEMVALRRHLHTHPEPSRQEHETSLHLYQLLSDHGFEVQMGPDGRGVVAEPVGQRGQARIAMRADIDALWIQDQKNVPYSSQRPGVMHACGHDAHTATVFGALLALRDVVAGGKLSWPIYPRAIFQPAEETSTGALEMIEAGSLEGIEAIFATHVDPTRPVGRIGTRAGMLTANCDTMRLVIEGRGGHAARPHESNDPIAAAAQLISTLYLFVPRATDSQDAVVITIGKVDGGNNPNVIPERVELFGTLRTLRTSVRERTKAHIHQLVRGIEEISGTRIGVEFDMSTPSVENDRYLTDLVCRAADSVLGVDHRDEIPRPSMGSEDFASYLKYVPGVMFRLGTAGEESSGFSLHTPTFDIDEKALKIGAKILAHAVVAWSEPGAK